MGGGLVGEVGVPRLGGGVRGVGGGFGGEEGGCGGEVEVEGGVDAELVEVVVLTSVVVDGCGRGCGCAGKGGMVRCNSRGLLSGRVVGRGGGGSSGVVWR